MPFKNLDNKIFDVGVIIMFSLPLLPSYIQVIAVAFFLVFGIYGYFRYDIKICKKKFIINASIYLLLIISLIYSENLDYAWKKLQTMSSLIIFPIIFSIIPHKLFHHKQNDKNKFMFIYLVAILILNITFFIYHFGHYKADLLIHYPTVTKIHQGPYNLHPIYLSIYICIAIIFSFFLIKTEKSRIKIICLLFIDIILILFLLILMKKGPILGLAISLTLFIAFQKRKYLWFTYFLILSVSAITIINIPKLKNKFSELVAIENIDKGNLTSTNIRYSIYTYAFKVIQKSPIIGHGIGDFKDELVKEYKKKNQILYKEQYNSHNQYISFILSIGLIGLISFIIMLGYNFNYAIKFENQVLIILLVFYCFMMLFENILERQAGVIMFSFFINYFSFNNKKGK